MIFNDVPMPHIPPPTRSTMITPCPSLATHTTLTNPDLVELIFENLSITNVWELLPEEVISRRKVLMNAALTSKCFLEPALDRLWRSLDKLFPLFKLLPAFYRSDSTFVLRGHISEGDWDRFDWYARRVKSFCYTRDPDSLDIAMHVYFRIAQLRKQPLLPSLRHLRCPHISQDDFLISSICLFLTPSLKILDFEKITGVEDKLIGTFLHTLLCEGARIEKVVMVGEGLTRDTLEYLGRCVYLRSLVVSGMGRYVGMDVIRSLGRIQGLEELELDLEESRLLSVNHVESVAFGQPLHGWTAPPRVSPSTTINGEGGGGGCGRVDLGFRELTSLEFVAPLSFVKTFLMSIGTTQLRHVGFESSLEGTVDRKDLLNYISGRWKEVLVHIRMVHSPEAGTDEEAVAPRITVDTLSPLLGVPQLSHLEVEGYTLDLSDANLSDMAAAWPGIHTLQLPVMPTASQRPSLLSLQVLSRQCPDLRYLTLPLDITEVSVLQETRVSLHRLQILTVTSADEAWELKRAMRLARDIDHLFPHLDKVSAYAEEREGSWWSQVHQMVKMCQSVRREAMDIYRASIDV